MNRAAIHHKVADYLIEAATWISVGSLFLGFGLVVFHAFEWLKYGAWPEYSARQFLQDLGSPLPHTSWLGVQRAYDWLLGLPFAVMGPVALIVFSLLLVLIAKSQVDEARQAEKLSSTQH